MDSKHIKDDKNYQIEKNITTMHHQFFPRFSLWQSTRFRLVLPERLTYVILFSLWHSAQLGLVLPECLIYVILFSLWQSAQLGLVLPEYLT